MGIICGKRSRAPKASTGGENDGDPVSLAGEEAIPLQNLECRERGESLEPLERVELEESLEHPERVETPEFPFSSPAEYYRLRIVGEHYYTKDNQTVLRQMDLYNKNIPIRLYLEGDKMNFMQHYEVYDSNMKKITDLTKIGMVSAQRPGDTILYRWDPNENKWQLSSTYRYRMYGNKHIKKPKLCAIATHFKDHQGDTKKEFLTEPFYFSPPIPFDRIIHITYYNIHLEKIKESVLVKGKKYDKRRYYFAVWFLPMLDQRVFVEEDSD